MSIRRTAILAAALLLVSVVLFLGARGFRPRPYRGVLPIARGVLIEAKDRSPTAASALPPGTPPAKQLGGYVCEEWIEVPEGGLLPPLRGRTWWELYLEPPPGDSQARHTDQALLAAAATHVGATRPEIPLAANPAPDRLAGERRRILPSGILSLMALILWLPVAGAGGYLGMLAGRRYLRRWRMRCPVCNSPRRNVSQAFCPDCGEDWVDPEPEPAPAAAGRDLALDDTWDEDPEDLQERRPSRPPSRPPPR